MKKPHPGGMRLQRPSYQRPQTATSAARPRRSAAATRPATSGRTVRSARARMSAPEAEPPDLIPPEWSPLLCEMTPEVLGKRPDSGYETQDGCGTRSGTGSDEEQERTVNDRETPFGRASLPSRSSQIDFLDSDADNDEIPSTARSKGGVSTFGSAGGENASREKEEGATDGSGTKTNEQLKEFLSAAMDSVRFFLVTSSIGQAHKKKQTQGSEDSDSLDSGSEEDEEKEEEEKKEEGVKPFNRAELLIMNGALMDPPWRFSMETYRDDPDMLEYYTGFRSYDLIKSVFALVKPSHDTVPRWRQLDPQNARESAFKSGILTLSDEFFMFLYKLRHNPSTEDLSVRFSMTETMVTAILDDWLHYLYSCFGQGAVWPTRDNMDIYMPPCFRAVCPCARVVLHTATLSVRCPPDYAQWERRRELEEEVCELEKGVSGGGGGDPGGGGGDGGDGEPELGATPSGSTAKDRWRNKIAASVQEKITKKIKWSAGRKLMDKLEYGEEDEEKRDEGAGVGDPADILPPSRAGAVMPDSDDIKHLKSVVVFQPTGAVCMVSDLYPAGTPSEEIVRDVGFLSLLDECDDVITVDAADDLDHGVVEELLHPYAANYMNVDFLTGCMSAEEFQKRAPMKAHWVKCMRWHIYQSVRWVRKMKVWHDLAELTPTWIKYIRRVWTISFLLTNFMPVDHCLDMTSS